LLYTGKTSKCNNNTTRNHQNHHQNPQDPNQYTPSMELIALIHAACTKGDYLVLKQILALKKQRSYAVANCSCSCGLTPLQIACFEGHLRLVKLLLEYQGDPNKCGNPIEIKRHMSASTKTPLVYASAHANAELVSVLLENGATFEVDALMEACRHGHIQVVQLLLLASKKQLDMDTLYKAVSFCVSNANGKNLLTVLLEDGQSFESRKKIFSCLFLAFSHSHASILKAFVEIYSQEIIQKAVKLHSHVHPLHLASTKGCSQSVDLLLKMGFPPDEIDPARGITPLFLACARGHSDVVDRLLQAGANVFVMGPNQETPLHIAAQENHFNCVELLLSNASRVEVDALTQDKCTPLHLASQRGNTRVVQCLLLHGAQVNALTSSNETPLIKASRMSYTETVKVLLAHHAKQSPVQHAPTNGILEPVATVDTTNTIKDQEEEEEVMIFLAKSHRRMSLSKWLKNVVNRK
jgi:ankyrin